MLNPDPPLQSHSPPSVTDAGVDIVDREPNAEHTEDHLPDPSSSRNQYDMV